MRNSSIADHRPIDILGKGKFTRQRRSLQLGDFTGQERRVNLKQRKVPRALE